MLHAGAKRRSVKISVGKIEMYFYMSEEGTRKTQVSSIKLKVSKKNDRNSSKSCNQSNPGSMPGSVA